MLKKALLIVSLSIFMYSCTDDENNENENPTTTATVQLSKNANLGNILTDSEGKTLYYFSLDHDGQSVSCNDGCLNAWPIFYNENITVSEGLSSEDFNRVMRPDGSFQSTYKGWPLYYFNNDTKAGDVNGEGVNNVWFVAKPDYSIMIANAQLIGKDSNGVETELKEDYTPGKALTFYFTDAEGNTLYRFFQDKKETNNYTKADFSNNALWPIYEIDLNAIPSTLNKADFKTMTVHGRTQLTYKGWPLYKFQQDLKRGDNYGVGFPSTNIWPIVNEKIELAN